MYNHWFVSRQKRKLTQILPALIAFNEVVVGQVWKGNGVLQEKFEDELGKKGITNHGSLRARRVGQGGGGIRTLFKQLKDLGLIFVEETKNTCQLTLVGESLVRGDLTFVEAMKMQLKKYQYPSATVWSGSGGVDHGFKVHPFRFMLRLLCDSRLSGYLTMDEMKLIVIHDAKSDSNTVFESVVEAILHYRNTGSLLIPRVDESTNTFGNIANTFFNYIGLTQLVNRGDQRLTLRPGREDEARAFSSGPYDFLPHPENQENYQRAYGRGNAAKDLRSFSTVTALTPRQINERAIKAEYVLLALSTPITEITADIVKVISDKTGIDDRFVEDYLRRNFVSGNTDDFFLRLKELAFSGRDSAKEFELATCTLFEKVFKMKAKHVGPIGNTPDVFVESESENFSGIIDNKSYHTHYSISGDHRRIMEDVYIPNVATYSGSSRPLAFFSYISGSFGTNIDNQVLQIFHDTGIRGSAMPVDVLIDFAQDYLTKSLSHADILRIFSINRSVMLSDV